ncbi:OmpA family protein [Sphingobacterium sp. DK4209]|uniref:OmpA family protein n=1 Tax=Sphingobacterium zhuxiongii TaxID=2662364 RepID=A0A5Q0QCJ0_9SPHI|nr:MULTISPECIES: OmpA family protein [unclassified Sphingobacterium]MVZ66426.1 OmpA family protein [Sphingobacterium sp. DK4209]QGA27273.1 OmpA family protein [Sphingobacterium sp. dk4302]
MQLKKLSIYCFLLLLLALGGQSYAQAPSAVRKAQQAYLEAGKALGQNQLAQAADWLEKATKADPSFATAFQQLGDVYKKMERYQQAITAYEHVLSVNPSLTSLTYFGLGESYLVIGNYTQASNNFQQYQLKGKLSEKSTQLVDKYLADCAFSLKHLNDESSGLIALSTAINTDKDEYYPKLTADNARIIFTRKENNQENFYESLLTGDQWSEAIKLPEPINTAKFNEGAHCISPDGKYLFFTGCNRPDGLGSCDLYVSKKENGTWSDPFNLGPGINTRGWESQPAISADGKTLYFVSNRAGGQGSYDIWKATLLADGKWSSPVNLGPEINSPYDEGAPYLHADNKTLYFSSNGWPGFGKNDIFQSTLSNNGQWSTPENLGPAINNYLDQRSFHVSLDGSIAHLASQDQAQQWDIYRFDFPKEKRAPAIAYIAGFVFDKANKKPLDASIRVTNTNTKELVFERKSDYLDGGFIAVLPVGSNYAVHIQKEGYLFDSKQYALDKEEFANKHFQDSIFLEPILAGAIATLRNIYFDVNKFEILSSSESELDLLLKLLESNPKLSIEIAGHTDNTGNKNTNQILSEQRAQSVANWLKAKGIASARLEVKGYGDSKPIAPNTSEEGKQSNRRTEFIVK